MNQKQEPIRTCVGCRQKRPKKDLIRVAKSKKQIKVTNEKETGGRGAYFCPQESCFLAAKTKSRLEKALRISLTEDDWQQLEKEFKKVIKMD